MNKELNILDPLREGIAISFHRALNIVGIYVAWWAGFGMAWLKAHKWPWKIKAPSQPLWKSGYAHIAYYAGYGLSVWRFMTRKTTVRRGFTKILASVMDESRRLQYH